MKIKTKKQMNLLELIQGVWEGDLKAGERKSDYGNTVFIWSQGLETYKGVRIQGDEVFTVEVEEDLTKHTYFNHLMEVTKDNLFEERIGMTIEGAVRPNTSALYIIEGGAFHLIWSRDSGIPESGVLEVSE